MRVFDPPRVLEYTWEEDVLRFELRPEGKGCLLVFTTWSGDRSKAARDATGWHLCLDNLEAAVDGNPAAGFDKERFSALSAEYAARFGLGAFPSFMTSPANRVADSSLHIPGVDVYVFDGADGTQLTLCHAKSDASTGERWRDSDEYLVVLEGSYVLTINGTNIQLDAGREFVIPQARAHLGAVRRWHADDSRPRRQAAGAGGLVMKELASLARLHGLAQAELCARGEVSADELSTCAAASTP